jgi:hypothetical protein
VEKEGSGIFELDNNFSKSRSSELLLNLLFFKKTYF